MNALKVALLLVLTAVSVGLAAVEAAFYSLKRRRLSHVAQQNPRADLANRYLEDPPTLLMPVHMGTYTAHVAMTIVITSMLIDLLAHWAMVVALATMLVYLLLFRLTLPYAIVRHNPERMLLLLLPVFHAYARVLSPVVATLRRRAAHGTTAPEADEPITIVPAAPPPPPPGEDEDQLVEAVSRFTETQVKDVMTPRPDVVAIAGAATVGDLRRLMRETKYSRIPVYGENLDDIVGAVGVRDLVEHDGDSGDPVRHLARPAFLVPETKKISDLLKELQARRTTFAVVIDEYGGTAGLVTVEDIVEEIVGEIKDEFDVEAEPIVEEADGSVLVAGRVNVDRLEQALEAPLADGDVGTVGGLVTAAFGRVPRVGETIDYRGFTIEVTDAERKRVNRVRVRRQAAAPEPA